MGLNGDIPNAPTLKARFRLVCAQLVFCLHNMQRTGERLVESFIVTKWTGIGIKLSQEQQHVLSKQRGKRRDAGKIYSVETFFFFLNNSHTN